MKESDFYPLLALLTMFFVVCMIGLTSAIIKMIIHMIDGMGI